MREEYENIGFYPRTTHEGEVTFPHVPTSPFPNKFSQIL
jgi:hypothetical protein